MLCYFPVAIEDRRIKKKITELSDGETACVKAMVIAPVFARRVRNNLTIFSLPLRDETGALTAVFFNTPYVMRSFAQGDWYNFFGKVSISNGRRTIAMPVYEKPDAKNVTDTIVPVYRLTNGITQKMMVSTIRACFELAGNSIEDFLPPSICEKYHLCRADYAIRNIHFPTDYDSCELARKRLAFEELFLLQLALKLKKSTALSASVAPFRDLDISPLLALLPFELTQAQSRVIGEIISDFALSTPMNRLVQGDVGCGKTAVALAALYLTAKNGFQGAMMAPTELLARQHYASLSPTLSKLNIKSALLVGSMSAKEKKEVCQALFDGTIDIVFGTHALFQDSVSFHALRLVVTDEQHRFGVRQRGALVAKGDDPHILVMTATPIPRTLALVIYGDLNVSVIDTLPPGRQKVDTFCKTDKHRERLYSFIRKEVSAGHKAYIICPMVEDNPELDLKSAVRYAENLRKNVFPDLKVGLVHGKLPASEKDAAMQNFAHGDTDILVSTTVVEVGVDVPSATLMIIEDAERFGLSQLHQLRGRVGRGKDKSYCFLIVSHLDDDVKKRMSVMTQTNDGFRVAEADLEIRGPGEFFGTLQHGLPPLKIASLLDMDTLKQTSSAANDILTYDPHLEKEENLPLKRRLKSLYGDMAQYLV